MGTQLDFDVVAERDAALSAAALQLLTASADDGTQLAIIRQLLQPLASNPVEPAWVRQALTTGVELLDHALDGSVAQDSAIARVSALIELVMRGGAGHGQQASSGANLEATQFTLPPDAARELFGDFIAETADYLAQIERAVLELAANASDSEAINTVFRAAHTIKSTAAFLGLEPISALAHSAESLLCHVRDGRVGFSRTFADLTLHCTDVLRELLAQAGTAVDGGTFEIPITYVPLMQRLKELDAEIASGASLIQEGHAPEPGAHVAQRVITDRMHPAALVEPAQTIRTPVAETAHPARDAADNWIRVRTERLNELVDLIGELVVAQSMLTHEAAVRQDPHAPLARKVSHTSKLVRELQSLGMTLRMVPLRPLFQKLQRLVHDLSNECDKQIEFVTAGEDTEIDRNMVDILADPLIHMVRNAIDHGLEAPADRAAAGKPPVGTLRLTAAQLAGNVVVELHDDGRGLDHERILDNAIAKGLVAPGSELSHGDICNLIFAPGLSTAKSLTELSGRGVGMDVVRRNIDALRGRIEICSTPGAGTTFTLRLPLTLAVTDGMLVRVGAERYIVPTASIQMSFRPVASALTTVAGAGELVMLHGSVLPIVRLHELFGVPRATTQPTEGILVVLESGGRRYALLVDELLGQQQFVAKPVGTGLASVQGVAGAAILGDGCVGLILDTAGIIAAR